MRKNVQTGIKLFLLILAEVIWSYVYKGNLKVLIISIIIYFVEILLESVFLKCFLGSLACSSKTGKLLSPEGVVQFTKYSSNMVRYVFKYVITIFYKTHNLTTNLNSLFNTIRQLSYNINNNLYIFMLH